MLIKNRFRNFILIISLFCSLLYLGNASAAWYDKNSSSQSSIAQHLGNIFNSNESNLEVNAKDLQRLSIVIAEIKKYYVKKVSDKTLFDNAISGMLSGLDPHSEYLNKEDLDNLQMLTTGKFDGIGIEVVSEDGLIRVISPLDGTPAYKAGIKAGDLILQIDKKLVKDMTLTEAISLMRGPKGSKVKLVILRKNDTKPLIFNVARDTIKVQTVKQKLFPGNFGYVRIAIFQDPTSADFHKAIAELQRQTNNNIQGLILDLRNNPGGLLDSSVKIADDLLDSRKLKGDKVIVYTKGMENETQVIAKATPGELLPGVPIVVLINEGSASASEIVAGALQDYKRAILVGTRSFGKGSVQTLLPVDEDSAIKLTTSLYYTPTGRSIQAKGIEPDIVINEDIKLKSSDETASEFERIDEASLVDHLQNGGDTNSDNNRGSMMSEKDQMKNNLSLANEDYQLFEALNILRGISINPNYKNQ